MARLPHLQLTRIDRTEDRRRKSPPPGPPPRGNPAGHGGALANRADAAAAEQAAAPQIRGINPELILKVSLSSAVQEEHWRAAGFRVLAQEPGQILVLFSDDIELRLFRQRLEQYRQGIAAGRQNPTHHAFFASIEDIASISSVDRIGPRFRDSGVASPQDIIPGDIYTVDIELWDAPSMRSRVR